MNETLNPMDATAAAAPRYLAPDWFSRRVFNPTAARLTRWGLSLWGSRLLEVTGRTSGVLRTTIVNVLEVDGQRYLVAPRGVTHWVRNVRAAGGAGLRLGRRVERVDLVELPDADKPAVLRAYLRRWWWEVGQFFDDIDRSSSDEELLAAAAGYPVFRIEAN